MQIICKDISLVEEGENPLLWNFMSHFKILAFIGLVLVVHFWVGCSRENAFKQCPESKEDPAWQSVVDYANQHLPLEGKLRVKTDGFTYLKVDDAYIQALFPKLGLKEQGFRMPPYFRRSDSPGAHISVFYANEHIFPEEIGQIFHFKLKKILVLPSSKNASYAVLQVECPELEKLREKYGVSSKLLGREFHITLAKKKKRLHFK